MEYRISRFHENKDVTFIHDVLSWRMNRYPNDFIQ
jgi:hypothetical protein